MSRSWSSGFSELSTTPAGVTSWFSPDSACCASADILVCVWHLLIHNCHRDPDHRHLGRTSVSVHSVSTRGGLQRRGRRICWKECHSGFIKNESSIITATIYWIRLVSWVWTVSLLDLPHLRGPLLCEGGNFSGARGLCTERPTAFRQTDLVMLARRAARD